MKREHRLYNVIFPIWMLVLFPQVWLIVIPGNLLVDCLLLLLTLLALKHRDKGGVVKQLWWKFWLLGFAADAIGVAWMLLGWLLAVPFGSWWESSVGHIMHNAFAHPAAFLCAFRNSCANCLRIVGNAVADGAEIRNIIIFSHHFSS